MEEPNRETPLSEITTRLEAFAAQRGYGFSRAKDKIIRELVYIHQHCGDFYCPCRGTCQMTLDQIGKQISPIYEAS